MKSTADHSAGVGPAIAEKLRQMLPTIEELAAIEDPGDMGPDVTFPAIWGRLLLLYIQSLEQNITLAEMRLAGVVGAISDTLHDRIGRSDEMPEDQTADFAGRVAEAAMIATGDPTHAILALFQAAGSIAVSKLTPPEFALTTFEGAFEVSTNRLAEVLGHGQVRQ